MIKITKQSVKNYFKIAWRELAIIAGVLFIDLLSKFLISKFMTEGQTVTLIPNFLHFYYTKNPLASFNFDFFGLSDKLGEEGMRIFFIVFMSLAVVGFILFLISGHKNRFFYRLPLSLIIGGAMGNLYDRIFHQAVRDFIQVEYFGKTLFGQTVFATFNLADSALVIGVILFLVYFVFFYFKDEKKKEEAKIALKSGGDTLAANESGDNCTCETVCESCDKAEINAVINKTDIINVQESNDITAADKENENLSITDK